MKFPQATRQLRTLDSMAGAFPDLFHTCIKIDTQGFDLVVLKGGCDVVRQVPALQTEVSLLAQYLNGPTMDDSLAAFFALEFRIADFFWSPRMVGIEPWSSTASWFGIAGRSFPKSHQAASHDGMR